jgi:NitT/TauT family transport system permease protein
MREAYRRSRRYWRGRIASLASLTASCVALLLIWQLAVVASGVPSYVLPGPVAVWHALVAGLDVDPTSRLSFLYQLSSTLEATVIGFLIGGALGVALAALMAEFRVVQRAIFPYVVGFQSLPKVAIAPLYVIWFGYQMQPKVAMAATLTLFPVLLNSLQGFASVERDRMELMASLDASRWQSFWLIKLPSASPLIFAGLNLGIVYALLGTIVAEFIGAQRGMGVVVTQLQSTSDTAGVFAVLVVLAVAGYLLIAIMRLLQRRVVFWSGADSHAEAP